jgi:hypothetical protein
MKKKEPSTIIELEREWTPEMAWSIKKIFFTFVEKWIPIFGVPAYKPFIVPSAFFNSQFLKRKKINLSFSL